MNNANKQVVNAQGAETKQVKSPETMISATIVSCKLYVCKDKDDRDKELIIVTTSNGYDMISMYRTTFENLISKNSGETFIIFNKTHLDNRDDKFLKYFIGCPITYSQKEYTDSNGEIKTKFVAEEIIFDENNVLDKILKYRDLLKV